jgi:hypothetical protein
LPILYHADAKNTDSWHVRKGDLQRVFLLDVLMVSSSAIATASNGEHLTCGEFSLGETIHLVNFEFITDDFSGLRLSHRRGDAGATFMGSNHRGHLPHGGP